MTTIDPTTHADLIRLRHVATEAHAELLAYNPSGEDAPEQAEERRRLRGAAGDASLTLHVALRESDLVREHGWHQVDADLRNAARE